MEGNFIKLNKKLLPFSWFYGLGVGFRNLLFEMGILKQHSYKTPVISVGNITVGGTGKTPHVEYLINLLKDHIHVAVLSRGYKRKSRGFLMATPETPMRDLGDEPYQMKQKYPEIVVAVDAKRTRGIENLISGAYTEKEVDAILLDDAYQHRYVKPGLNILLVDFHRLIIHDKLLPAGRLREPVKGKDRADIVIVTKCPKTLNPMEFRVLTKQMNLYPYQQLYFTTIKYEPLRPLFPEVPDVPSNPGLPSILAGKNILLLTGIASPKQIYYDLKAYTPNIHPLRYGDHHNFKKKDIKKINETFEALPAPKLIVTTEKDAVRLKDVEGLTPETRRSLYVLPISIEFMLQGEELFNEKIIGYVRKNPRNSILAKGKDDHKSKDSHHSGNGSRTISFRNN
ncbi:MAG: tetraacyldisaccharide 4'-kinase [Prevotella sp.]|nr:tetraacyldisaccharide 4'-kinase [Prevotella sp.]